ncbi:MAG: DUF4956 domain-containing protein [Planctomycetes bacterium]|nr:DUF4956 domain-containing protein [Planctomycetota bacterium]
MTDLLQSLAGTGAVPSLATVAFHLLLAFVLALPLAWIYARTHHGVSYSRSFVQSLVLLAMIVTLVMAAVGDSVARAFGLFGALALIRFRTPIKDSRDTVFLFLSVAIGITVGVQNLPLAVGGTALVLVVVLLLHAGRFGERQVCEGVLRCSLPPAGAHDQRLRRVLQHYCRRFDLVSLRGAAAPDAVDACYHLQLLEPEAQAALVADVRAIPGVADVSLLVQQEDEEL